MCRPHFPAPLPWSLSEAPKSLASSGAWGSPFACPQDPQEKVSQAAAALQSSQSSGQHLFSFPPTPPKDSTPDSVQTGPLEYQAAVNAFMHQAQVTSNSVLTGDTGSCGLDIKPCLSNGNNQTASSAPKQREGTQQQQQQTTNHSNNNNNNTNSQNNNTSTTNNSSKESLKLARIQATLTFYYKISIP
uniref:CSON007824 protein n=1 Tax=Culicoides sonorensis TaxID=179676 RepID=A0A336LC09_CULSO